MDPLHDLSRHATENRDYWNGMAHDWVAAGERSWRQDEPTWGTWAVPERDVEMLPVDMRGMRAVELGCGTGYVSAWMARRRDLVRSGRVDPRGVPDPETRGRLVFLGNRPLAHVCAPLDGSRVTERLERPYFDMRVLDWTTVDVDPGGIEFCLGHADWYALFRRVGFVVEDYREPRPAEDTADNPFPVPAAWERRWPSEQVWKLRKVAADRSATP